MYYLHCWQCIDTVIYIYIYTEKERERENHYTYTTYVLVYTYMYVCIYMYIDTHFEICRIYTACRLCISWLRTTSLGAKALDPSLGSGFFFSRLDIRFCVATFLNLCQSFLPSFCVSCLPSWFIPPSFPSTGLPSTNWPSSRVFFDSPLYFSIWPSFFRPFLVSFCST